MVASRTKLEFLAGRVKANVPAAVPPADGVVETAQRERTIAGLLRCPARAAPPRSACATALRAALSADRPGACGRCGAPLDYPSGHTRATADHALLGNLSRLFVGIIHTFHVEDAAARGPSLPTRLAHHPIGLSLCPRTHGAAMRLHRRS